MEYPLPGASSYKKLSFPEKRERYHTHTHTHMMKYYSAIKTEIMPFAATWMDLEMIILSEVNQKRRISSEIAYILCNLIA